jgi:Bacterial membrane protein YfhO
MTRAIFVSADGVEVIPEEIPQLRRIADSHFDPARSVIMEDAPFHDLVQDVPTSGANNVSGLVQTPNEIRVDVNAVQRGVVVVSEILFPGWTAKIDGTPTKIIRADYALMGIPVERGSHSIVLTFSPLSYRIGAGVSIVSLILLVVATAFQRPVW